MITEIDLKMTKKSYLDFLNKLVTISNNGNHNYYELHKRIFMTWEDKSFCELKYNHELNFACLNKQNELESAGYCNNVKYNCILPFFAYDGLYKKSYLIVFSQKRGLLLFCRDCHNSDKYLEVKDSNLKLFI